MPIFALQLVVVGFVELRRSDCALRLSGLRPQVVDRRADLLDFGVAEFDRVYDRLFLHFFGAGLDHHDPVCGADDHDVYQALAHLAVGRINDKRAANQADAHRSDGAVKRNVRNRQRGRGTINASHVRIILRVRRKHERNHLRLALKSIGKQRPDRPVDLAAG